jgi:hypothetical protein
MNVDNQIDQLVAELSQKDEYIESCYVCGGCMLRKYAQNKRIASASPIIISSVTETETAKTQTRIEAGELREVYICSDCEHKLKTGEVINSETV